MHFSKFLTFAHLQSNAQYITDNITRSPIKPTEQKTAAQSQFNQTRNQTHFLSPNLSPSHHNEKHKDYRTHSPMVNSQHDGLKIKNPQTNMRKAFADYKEGTKLNNFNPKTRKGSQNNIVFEHLAVRKGKEELQKSADLSKKYIEPAPKPLTRERKTSCNLDVGVMFKKTNLKNLQPEEEQQNKNKPASLLLKTKSWDQNKHFQMNSQKNQSQKMEEPFDFLEIPKVQNIRKHSDNQIVKKTVPSFLSATKHHKNSIQLTDSFHIPRRRSLGIQNFTIIRQLGKGAFGKVVLARQKESGIVCAIKILSKRDVIENQMTEQVVRQLKIQLYINHPHIIKIYGYFDDLLHFYILLECAMDGHLSDHIQKSSGKPSELQISVIMNQICSAVSALHGEQIIHRDLKPQNIMLHDGIVKLCDFGWSVRRDSKLRSTFCGTPIYLCPEMLIGDEYDESIDIWALGVILYEMLYRSNPFKITCRQNLANIINEPIFFDERMHVSPSARCLIEMCLSKRAVDRPNIRELMMFQFMLQGQGIQQQKR